MPHGLLLQVAAQRFFNAPLLVHQPYAEAIATVLAPRLGIQPMVSGDMIPAARAARMPMLTDAGVMIIPVVGGLVHRGDSMDAMSGVESYTHLNNVIIRALKDQDCKAILLDIDSPGGEAGGCFELADSLLDARKVKPIWAVANVSACSAAYAIGCSASKFFATPMASVGSVGVVWMHVDISKAMAREGIVTSLIFAGEHKTDGNPFEPLPKDVRADCQASVDHTYGLFVDLVAARRPIKADAIRATEARVYRGDEAARLNLVDGVMSLQAALVELEDSVSSRGPRTIVHNSTATEETDSMTTFTKEQHDAALASARTDAHAAGVKEGDAAGYARGRADAGKILGSEAAKTRPAMAATLAGDADFSPEKSEKVLAAAGEEGKPSVLKVPNPGVGAGEGGTTDEDAKNARLASIREQGKLVSARPATR